MFLCLPCIAPNRFWLHVHVVWTCFLCLAITIHPTSTAKNIIIIMTHDEDDINQFDHFVFDGKEIELNLAKKSHVNWYSWYTKRNHLVILISIWKQLKTSYAGSQCRCGRVGRGMQPPSIPQVPHSQAQKVSKTLVSALFYFCSWTDRRDGRTKPLRKSKRRNVGKRKKGVEQLRRDEERDKEKKEKERKKVSKRKATFFRK